MDGDHAAGALPGRQPPPIEIAFWALMQVGFIIGFLTSYPAEWRGFKEAMRIWFVSMREGKALLLSALGASLVGLSAYLGGEFWSTSTAEGRRGPRRHSWCGLKSANESPRW